MTRHVIFNADDFGNSEGLNRGIIECHVRGVVTSASLMTTGPAAAQAAELAQEHPALAVGLHWDGGDGGSGVGNKRWARRGLKRQLRRQLEDFYSLMGQWPDHLDSHKHVHRNELAMPVFAEVAVELGIPLRHDGRVHYVGGFYAQRDDGTLQPDHVRVEFLQKLLALETNRPWTEIGCHPGYRSRGFRSSYLRERELEVQTLTDPRITRTIKDLGLRLASFADFRASDQPRASLAARWPARDDDS